MNQKIPAQHNTPLNHRSPLLVTLPDPEHIEGLVDCHVAALPNDVITLLGRPFLRTYYNFYRKHPSTICLVAVNPDDGHVVGFVVGGRSESRRYFARKHPCILLWSCLAGMLTNNRIRRRMLGAAKKGAKIFFSQLRTKKQTSQNNIYPIDSPNCGVLLTIGADPGFRRGGVGKTLVEAFRQQCVQKGLTWMRLMTKQENQAANALYQKTGWVLAGTRNGFNHYWRYTEQNTLKLSD